MQLLNLSISDIQSGFSKKEFSSKELTTVYLNQIEKHEPSVKAYLTLTPELALKKAEEVDKKIENGEKLSPLAGVPAAIKDNICTKGIKTTCASKMLENFVPPYDATVIKNLGKNDFLMLGKLNMDEFAMGSSTENSAFQITRNPMNLDYVPGGSSGGSAAAVAMKEAVYTLGSDTGGSIRQPASFCGVVGMKPTYGTVSRYGLVAFASSLDQIGPLTRKVRDNAIVLNAIASEDKMDATCLRGSRVDYTSEIDHGVKDMVIGLPTEFFAEGINPEVREKVLNAAKAYEKMGAKIEEIKLPNLKHALSAYYVISSAEASSNLARFDGVKYGYRSENADSLDEIYRNSRTEGFGAEVQRRIMLGTFALSSGYYDAYYKKALQVRTLIINDYNKVFEKCDMVLSPVAPTPAYKIGEKTSNPLEMYMGDIYSVPINIAGLPSLSIPCGNTKDLLPVGMQLIGKNFSEPTLYRAGYAFENFK